ncbi:MAG: hypothetical protein GEU99_02415 [Luteitalea sp.]|nr:hypothetical protein [Luteitalea sp.]
MDTPDDGRRPFYTQYAWAFDLLNDRPVARECATIVTWLIERGVLPGADVLDAGCGTGRGTLTFTSVTELDPTDRRLIVRERHALNDEGHEQSSDYVFVMRCWTRDELHSSLRLRGFGTVAYFGAYDAAVAAGTTDRLVAVTQLSGVAA